MCGLKHRGMANPRKGRQRATLVLLAAMVAYPLPAAQPSGEPPLDFRHGLSQIPNYDLKCPADFPHFDYVNPDAPKGGMLVLSSTISFDTVSPIYKPVGFYRAYDHLIERGRRALTVTEPSAPPTASGFCPPPLDRRHAGVRRLLTEILRPDRAHHGRIRVPRHRFPKKPVPSNTQCRWQSQVVHFPQLKTAHISDVALDAIRERTSIDPAGQSV